MERSWNPLVMSTIVQSLPKTFGSGMNKPSLSYQQTTTLPPFLAAAASRNLVNILINAQVLNDLLPSCLVKPANSNPEGAIVQSLLYSVFNGVFHKDEHFQVKWANAALFDEVVKYKPDFKVATQVPNKELTSVVAEIKPHTNHSSVESDTVELCRQMKQCFNDLVLAGVLSPVVCGLRFDGFFMETFVLDMPAPKVYRVVKLASVDIYRDLS